MTPHSAKAKGRRLQQKIRDVLLEYVGNTYNLNDDDIRSTAMGQHGEDIQLSSKARKVLPFNFEIKNQEKLNIWSALTQAELESTHRDTIPVVVFKRNHSKTYLTIEFDKFINFWSEYLKLKNDK